MLDPIAKSYPWKNRPTDSPMPLLERQRLIGRQAMISRVHLHKGCFVKTHAHENEQFAVVLSGRCTFGFGAEGSPSRTSATVGPDEVVYLPSNIPHSCEALEDTIILDIFSPPSSGTGIDVQGRGNKVTPSDCLGAP